MKYLAALASLLVCLMTGLWGLSVASEVPVPLINPGEILRGQFVQERHLAGFKVPLRSSGRFAVAPRQGLIWEALKPIPVTVAISPHGLVQRSGDKELMRLSSQQAPQFADLYRFLEAALAGDWSVLEARYDIVREADPRGEVVTLRPKQGESGLLPFEIITIDLEQFVTRIEIVKPAGDVDILHFAGFDVGLEGLLATERALLDMTLP